MAGKKIVFDEFINLHDWLVNEHRRLRADSLVARLIDRYMKWVHSRSDLILSDTEAHARLSAKTYETCRSKFVAVPVGTDERTFYPRERARRSDRFEVFFFGNMLPLHGMSVILESIESLAETRRIHGIHFSLVGGRGNPQAIRRISDFIETNRLGSSVTHLDWVPYQDLPDHIASADLCLGGPFGNTGQARRVVTGKTYQFLAMGKSTIIGAVEDLTGFEDKHNCLIVEQGAPELLADAIEWAFEHRDRLEGIGSHGLALFESHFSQHAQQQTLRRLVLDPLSL
ncbi:MAG: glycosyltransferase [Thermoleophilia bacterium]